MANHSALDYQQAARDHLWLHFTRMSGYRDEDVPIIVRGEGCYLEDSNGKRYLDALAGLFAVQVGYSYGEEIGQAALEQMRELPFYTNWSYGHPRAIELAHELASLTPGNLNRVFFVPGGSAAVESAGNSHAATRGSAVEGSCAALAYGTTMGALDHRHRDCALHSSRRAGHHVRNTNRYHRPPAETEEEFRIPLGTSDDVGGPDTVAMVIMEPVQNAGGRSPPADTSPARAICVATASSPPTR